MQGRAAAAGLSVGAFAARCVVEAVHSVPDLLVAGEGEPYTGSFGIEASLPRGDRPDAPDGEMLTQSGGIEPEGVPDHGLTPETAPNRPGMLTESEIRAEKAGLEDRRTRFENIMEGMSKTRPT